MVRLYVSCRKMANCRRMAVTVQIRGPASDSGKLYQETNVGSKIRSGVLFMVACLTSPCCTPLYVPLLFVLLAGTPAAVWLSANVGWVYGGLTLISIISFVLAFRWWSKFSGKQKRQTASFCRTTIFSQPQLITGGKV